MIYVELFIMAVCAALFWWGGYNWHNARRFIMPCVMAVTCTYLAHSWWVLVQLSVISIFVLGYGEKSVLRHCFGDGWGRGVWGVLSAICLSVPLFVTHHLGLTFGHLHLGWLFGSCFVGIVYTALNFILENALKKLPQFIADPIIGLAFSSIILLVIK